MRKKRRAHFDPFFPFFPRPNDPRESAFIRVVLRRVSWGRYSRRQSITFDMHHAARYYAAMIVSFKDPDTEALALGQRIRRFVNIEAVARRKLRQLEIAGRLDDLRVPPGNRLEALKGDRLGQYSIRINEQFRVCFRWTAAGAEDVEIVD